MNIIPSILHDERAVITQQLATLKSVSDDYEIDRVQVDIIDGEFADNLTITPLDLPDFDFGNMQIDLHLMTHEPLDFVYEAKEVAKEVQISSVIGQIERMSSQVDFVQEVKKQHWAPGLSVNAYTQLSELSPLALEEIEILQVMGIQAGFQGSSFIEHMYTVIAQAKELISRVNPQIELIVDGGVKADILAKLVELEVDTVVVGSVLWKAHSVEAGLDSLYEVLADVAE